MEIVGADHLVVPEEASRDVLDGANEDERDRLQRDDPEDGDQQPSTPIDVAHQHVDQREGHEEEAHVLQALGEVRRVERLQRVENDDSCQDLRQAARGA